MTPSTGAFRVIRRWFAPLLILLFMLILFVPTLAPLTGTQYEVHAALPSTRSSAMVLVITYTTCYGSYYGPFVWWNCYWERYVIPI